jgi:hypothetical protein
MPDRPQACTPKIALVCDDLSGQVDALAQCGTFATRGNSSAAGIR